MNENKIALLKIFSAVLKERSKTEPQYQSISTEMVKHFSRKELIEIINHNFEGEVPLDYNLVEMENNELLQLIGDDFKIISYVMSRWSKEVSQLPTLQEWMHSKVHGVPEKEKDNSELGLEENPTEASEHTPTTETGSENQDLVPEKLKNEVSESPKVPDASSEETERFANSYEINKQRNEQKKPGEKPSSKKPEKAKNP